jgi:hypothetical protein
MGPHAGAGVPGTGDQRQDVGEHLSWHRDFGHLARDVAAMARDLRVILTSFSRRLVSDQGSAVIGVAGVL